MGGNEEELKVRRKLGFEGVNTSGIRGLFPHTGSGWWLHKERQNLSHYGTPHALLPAIPFLLPATHCPIPDSNKHHH